MATHIAFLRAINLGARRKFAKGDIAACVESLGFAGVATHINTGNVRFETTLRSRAKIEQALEEVFLADRGFEVPTICFTSKELSGLGGDVEEIAATHSSVLQNGNHYVSLLKVAPSQEQVDALHEISSGRAASAGEALEIRGRAAHLLVGENYRTALLTNTVVERTLGVATNRNATVIRALAQKWGS